MRQCQGPYWAYLQVHREGTWGSSVSAPCYANQGLWGLIVLVERTGSSWLPGAVTVSWTISWSTHHSQCWWGRSNLDPICLEVSLQWLLTSDKSTKSSPGHWVLQDSLCHFFNGVVQLLFFKISDGMKGGTTVSCIQLRDTGCIWTHLRKYLCEADSKSKLLANSQTSSIVLEHLLHIFRPQDGHNQDCKKRVVMHLSLVESSSIQSPNQRLNPKANTT